MFSSSEEESRRLEEGGRSRLDRCRSRGDGSGAIVVNSLVCSPARRRRSTETPPTPLPTEHRGLYIAFARERTRE